MKLLTFAIAVTAAQFSQASLTWEKTDLEFHPTLNDSEVVAHFKFQNTGKSTVKITSVHPSCGCTTATLKKEEISAEEKGEITATFKIGERTGLQHKTITVNTDDPDHPQQVLSMKTFIPRLLELQPTFLYWAPGEELKPKTVTVTVGAEFNVKSITAKSSDSHLTGVITPGRTPKDFQITVTPTKPDAQLQGTISVVPDLGGAAVPIFSVNVRVR